MSRYRGNGEKCPHCGMLYHDFRTGLSFSDIWAWYWTSDEDSSKWRYKRRRTILGKWHQTKKEGWRMHVEHACPSLREPGDEAHAEGEFQLQLVEGIPF